MKFTASRLSEGNKVFPAEIHIEPTGLTVKIPGLFRGESKFFDYQQLASVDVDAPLVGYSTITFYAGGTRISAHGFTSKEVKQIKQAIEQGKSTGPQPTNTVSMPEPIIQQKDGIGTTIIKEVYSPMIKEGMKTNVKIYATVGKGIVYILKNTVTGIGNLITSGARKKAFTRHNELLKITDEIDILLKDGTKDDALIRIKTLEHDSTHLIPSKEISYNEFWNQKRKEYIGR